MYQNAAIASALTALSVRPSRRVVSVIVLLSILSLCLLVGLIYRTRAATEALTVVGVPHEIAGILVRAAQATTVVLVALAMSALYKALSLQAAADASIAAGGASLKKEAKASANLTLTQHQQTLLGLPFNGPKKPAVEKGEAGSSGDSTGIKNVRQRPPWVRLSPTQPSLPASSPALMVPVHPTVPKGSRGNVAAGAGSLWATRGSPVASSGPVSSLSPSGTISTLGAPYSSQVSPYSASSYVSKQSGTQASPLELLSTPWVKQRSFTMKDDIQSEEKLNKFLADVDTRMMEAAGKSALVAQGFTTPPPTLRGAMATTATASPIPTPVSLSSTPQSGPIRTLRMSPAQKGGPSPKKGEGELPDPMSLEEVTEGLYQLGILSQIDQWRDSLRQWFSKVLLNPLIQKTDSSHLQVMAAAAKLGLSITVSQVGGKQQKSGLPVPVSGEEWLSTMSPEEDALLNQLRALLLDARDAPPPPQPTLFGLQSPGPERVVNPLIQECLNAVTEHQRLWALMKGEWVKGLLPMSSMRPDLTVQRIRVLAEGTCVKKFDFTGSGGDGKVILDLASDPHLLLYLFCALLEHPQWMLHVDPFLHSSMQTGNNPLFLTMMPGVERFSEKHVAILSSAPTTLPAGACILAMGKQTPPVFALYWEKKLQFSLQGRTALWDAILLLCHRIKVAHGGVIRGISLDSPSYNLSLFNDHL